MENLKPPYASAGVIDEFFSRLPSLKPPPKTDSGWAKDLGLGANLPASIPSMLRWLGVVDADYKPDPKLWNELRLEDSRQRVLSDWIKTSYAEVFNAVEVDQADKTLLHSAFVRAYKSGETGRQITAFLTLCRYAGIATKATSGTVTKKAAPRERQAVPRPRINAPAPRQAKAPQRVKDKNGLELTVSLSVEIPASWDEAQIAERIASVRRALGASS